MTDMIYSNRCSSIMQLIIPLMLCKMYFAIVCVWSLSRGAAFLTCKAVKGMLSTHRLLN